METLKFAHPQWQQQRDESNLTYGKHQNYWYFFRWLLERHGLASLWRACLAVAGLNAKQIKLGYWHNCGYPQRKLTIGEIKEVRIRF